MRFFKRLLNRIRMYIENFPIFQVLAELAYKAELQKYATNLPVLSSADLTLVQALQNEGVVVTSLEALEILSTPLMIAAAKRLMPKIQATYSSKKSPLNEYSIHANSAQIMEFSEIFLWGLEERLLDLAENYIGLPIAYHGSYFRRDIVNNIQIKTRLWHIDLEDSRSFKIIVYLNNVDEDSGCFQYIPKSLTSKASHLFRYKYYIPDKSMQQIVPPEEWKSCIGLSGTVIFADTANIFHRGKVPVVSDRFAIFFDYTSRQPKRPYYCKSSLPKDDLLLLAKKLSRRQQECVFWRSKSL